MDIQEDASIDADEDPGQKQDMDKEYVSVESTETPPLSCNDVCEDVGLICDGLYKSPFIGNLIGGETRYEGGGFRQVDCETMPESSFQDRDAFIMTTCYCR